MSRTDNVVTFKPREDALASDAKRIADAVRDADESFDGCLHLDCLPDCETTLCGRLKAARVRAIQRVLRQ